MSFAEPSHSAFTYFEFVEAEYIKCPHCYKLTRRIELEQQFDDEKKAILCPSCHNEIISMDALRDF